MLEKCNLLKKKKKWCLLLAFIASQSKHRELRRNGGRRSRKSASFGVGVGEEDAGKHDSVGTALGSDQHPSL